jgi:hypothetical protein
LSCTGLPPLDARLLAAVREAPRRYRMPPLPADLASAAASGSDTALAFAIETARVASEHGSSAPQAVQDLFTEKLATLIRRALAPQDGDAAFQALVLRAQEPLVGEYVRLSQQLTGDRRALRTATDALAHPGKLRGLPTGALRDALARLHALAAAQAWTELAREIEQLLQQPFAPEHRALQASLRALLARPELARLIRGAALLGTEAVQRYAALCAQRGPVAGSDAAAAQGRVSARLGDSAEEITLRAFGRIAALLNGHPQSSGEWRVVGGLRAPRGLAAAPQQAKDEWDVALLRNADRRDALDIVLLAEVKAAPAAAAPDFPRLQRGLRRLAGADEHEGYVFQSADGELPVSGESLRRLQPHGSALPAHVIYCCTAPAEAQPAMLSAASRGLLLAEPASIAFAQRVTGGESPPHAALASAWEALTTAGRLRPVLHQYETSQVVREAMLHPEDLATAARQTLGRS